MWWSGEETPSRMSRFRSYSLNACGACQAASLFVITCFICLIVMSPVNASHRERQAHVGDERKEQSTPKDQIALFALPWLCDPCSIVCIM